MTESPFAPSAEPTPELKPAAENAAFVDGVVKEAPVRIAKTAPAPVTPSVSPTVVKVYKRIFVFFGMIAYAAYACWCIALLSLLPSSDVSMVSLSQIAPVTVLAGAGAFVIIGVLLFLRIVQSTASSTVKQRSLIRLAITILPGLMLSGFVPVMILKTPSFPMDTVPASATEFVAPMPITLSLKRATEALKRMGKVPVQYVWYTDNTGKPKESTVTPEATIIFSRAGIYTVTARVLMADGTDQIIRKSILINQEVFQVTPDNPIVEQPARFSVSQLVSDQKLIKQVQWDFDGNGSYENNGTRMDAVHTYYTTGQVTVTALVDYTNQTQKKFTRTVEVKDPPPLPFPLTLNTEPKNLLGPIPFGVLFSMDTNEPLKEVVWDFGDGKQDRGTDLRRVGHTYQSPGIYSAVLQARSASGSIDQVTTIVRVTDILSIPDLHFDSKPTMRQDSTLSGEVPLTVSITPQTNLPLIQYSWENPSDDTQKQVTAPTYETVFRREGNYTITMTALGPDGSTRRVPIQVQVTSPAPELTIDMQPDGGIAPLHVTFDASDVFIPSGEMVAGFRWEFGDEDRNQTIELGGARIEHTYVNPGEYQLKLTVVTVSGKQFSALRTVIVRRAPLSACVTASNLRVEVGESVSFDSSCSTGSPVTTLWDIRNAKTPGTVVAQSDSPLYQHVFDLPGNYVVTLKLKDDAGYTSSKSVTITVIASSTSSASQ
jgi:PKD repeat protein